MKHLGDILVESEIISFRTLERALERQQTSKKRLGTILEEMGVISEDELVDALSKQFNFKTIKIKINCNKCKCVRLKQQRKNAMLCVS